MSVEAGKVSSLTPPQKTGGQQMAAGAAKPPKEPKAPKVPKESNFKKLYPDTASFRLLVEKNPKRAGSASYDRFQVYFTAKNIGDALAKGVTYADLSWDVGHGFISVTK